MTSLCFSAYPDECLLPRNAMLSFQSSSNNMLTSYILIAAPSGIQNLTKI